MSPRNRYGLGGGAAKIVGPSVKPLTGGPAVPLSPVGDTPVLRAIRAALAELEPCYDERSLRVRALLRAAIGEGA